MGRRGDVGLFDAAGQAEATRLIREVQGTLTQEEGVESPEARETYNTIRAQGGETEVNGKVELSDGRTVIIRELTGRELQKHINAGMKLISMWFLVGTEYKGLAPQEVAKKMLDALPTVPLRQALTEAFRVLPFEHSEKIIEYVVRDVGLANEEALLDAERDIYDELIPEASGLTRKEYVNLKPADYLKIRKAFLAQNPEGTIIPFYTEVCTESLLEIAGVGMGMAAASAK